MVTRIHRRVCAHPRPGGVQQPACLAHDTARRRRIHADGCRRHAHCRRRRHEHGCRGDCDPRGRGFERLGRHGNGGRDLDRHVDETCRRRDDDAAAPAIRHRCDGHDHDGRIGLCPTGHRGVWHGRWPQRRPRRGRQWLPGDVGRGVPWELHHRHAERQLLGGLGRRDLDGDPELRLRGRSPYDRPMITRPIPPTISTR